MQLHICLVFTTMKILKICFSLILIIFVASCSKIDENMEEMIPADCLGVMRVDVNSLLEKGALTDQDQNITLPQSLIDALETYDSPLSKAILLGKKIGIDTDGCLYCFLPKHTFAIASLVAVEDADEAKSAIEKSTGGKFQTLEGVDFLRDGAVSYVIDDHFLFIGKEMKEAADANLAIMAKSILHANDKGINQNADICEVLHKESDVNVYLSMKGMQKKIAASETLTEKIKKFPILSLFTDSDIQAISLHLNFEKEGAKLDANIKADDKSDYAKLFDATITNADASVLKVIPVSMNFIVSISVKGENLMKLDQVKKSINLISNLPAADQLDVREMIRSINGPVAIAFSPGQGMNISDLANDNWNVAVAAKTDNAKEIVNNIVAFAASMGQEDFVKNGRHLFSYEGMPVYLGEQEGIVYAVRLDHEMEEEFYYDMPDAKERFSKSKIGCYARFSDPKGDSFFNIGLNDAKNADGVYYSMQDNNPVVAFLELLCRVNASDENSDN